MYFGTIGLVCLIMSIISIIFGLYTSKFDSDETDREFGNILATIGIVSFIFFLIIAVMSVNYIIVGKICKMSVIGGNGNVQIDDTWYSLPSYDYRDLVVGDIVTLNVVDGFGVKLANVLVAPKHTGECNNVCKCNCSVSGV